MVLGSWGVEMCFGMTNFEVIWVFWGVFGVEMGVGLANVDVETRFWAPTA